MAVAARRRQRLRAAMEALAEHPDGMPLRDVWREVCRRVPPHEEDLELNASGRVRGETDLAFYGVDLVKAGWLRRENRVWSITEEGRRALSDYPDPEEFGRVAKKAYREWQKTRPSPTDTEVTDSLLPTRPGERAVLDAAALIVERGLRTGGSAFARDRSVWSVATVEELYVAFVERPDLSSGLDFITKLQRQLADCSDDAVLLTAELLTLNVLPLDNVSAATKRSRIGTVLSWMARPVDVPPLIDQAFEHGVFGGGVGYNVQIWKMLSLLIQFVRHWHGVPVDEREAALDDPWAWKRIVFDAPGPNIPSQREALLYLVHPETFLPIVSSAHKRAIRDAFASEIDARSGDIDRDLLQITLALQADQHEPIEYYRSPYVEQWRAGAAAEADEEASTTRHAWLVRGSSVNGRNLVPTWLAEGWVSLAASTLRPVEAGLDRIAIKQIVDADYAHKSYAARMEKVTEFHAFLTRMREGDVIATTSGGSIYLGVVTGPAEYAESSDKRSNLSRSVDWRDGEATAEYAALPAPLPAKLSSQADVVDLTDELSLLEQLLGEESIPRPKTELRLRSADDALANSLLIDKAWLEDLIESLRRRRQVILYGPPGTGKTYIAQHLAWHLTEPHAVKLVQFHPSYSYEDFFEGFRPAPGEEGKVGFELKPGPFRRVVEAARQEPSTPYILIIDEINRANLAKVFGELYFLLEYRDQSVGLLYSAGGEDDFTLPRNVFLIGTMNTADRSIALVDTAMRRRFAFVSLHPADEPVRGLLGRWLARHKLPQEAASLLAMLNARVPSTDFAIGPSYLMDPSVYAEDGLERVWRTSIMPLLEELHYGEGIDLESRYGLTALRKALAAQQTTEQPPGEATEESTGQATEEAP